MKIGFATIYSWRPHVEHMYFLSKLAEQAGHQVEFLTCDSDLETCYTRELRDVRPKWQECALCRAGGIRSYSATNVSSLREFSRGNKAEPSLSRDFARSSASTLGRFESTDDFRSEEFSAIVETMAVPTQQAYDAARDWIKAKKLDAVCVFNGRMDATRAIFEAAKLNGIPVVSAERTWFGDGLQLYPEENCLGLKSVHRLVREWRDRPLTHAQAETSAGLIASRFLKKNQNEWRAYNVDANMRPWPVETSRRKILLLPGSRNEIWGHPDWTSGWAEPTDAYDALIAKFGLEPRDLVLRCHPNWAEKIGKNRGNRSEEYYKAWAAKRQVLLIPAHDATSTPGLIEQCDSIVVSNGSAALEAGALGKQVIGTAPAFYQEAGFRDDASGPSQLEKVELVSNLSGDKRSEKSLDSLKLTLRFCYTMTQRIPQYVQYVKSISPTQYRYRSGADPEKFVSLLRGEALTADDSDYADDERAEGSIVNKMRLGEWDSLYVSRKADKQADDMNIARRRLFRPIDGIRLRMKRGDR